MGILKQIYRYTHSREYRHNENYWPDISITRSNSGEISEMFYKKQRQKIKNIHDIRCCAENVLIVASGPSIKSTVINADSYDTLIAVNGSYFLNESIHFTHYMVVDQDFILKRKDIIKHALDNDKLIFITTVACYWRIKNIIHNDIKCHLIIVEDICEKTYKKKVSVVNIDDYDIEKDKINKDIAFSKDIRKGIADCGTVVYWAMQVAYFMNAKKIEFAGLDMNNFNLPRFYETYENKQPTKLEDNFTKKILPAFMLASTIFKEKGVKLLNLSKNSAIPHKIISKVGKEG
ncbi:sugar glycosyltransferase [Edwardsiella tarda]|uniref:sugar glycosyltransferase n=1 Tax=Edwardsiella tarda TaxID=636 RepID=UPI00351CB574